VETDFYAAKRKRRRRRRRRKRRRTRKRKRKRRGVMDCAFYAFASAVVPSAVVQIDGSTERDLGFCWSVSSFLQRVI